jgi:mannose-1-phosphate guanylyltransferase
VGKNYPTISEFVATITGLVEKTKISEALLYYKNNRNFYPSDNTLFQFDGLIQKLEKMQTSVVKS